jgi:hypothetical protein
MWKARSIVAMVSARPPWSGIACTGIIRLQFDDTSRMLSEVHAPGKSQDGWWIKRLAGPAACAGTDHHFGRAGAVKTSVSPQS